jgi:hypothetical protein
MNIILTDGRHLVASRCRTLLTDENPSLFYCVGSGAYDKKSSVEANSICISSEPMSSDSKWTMIPCNHLLVVPCVEGDITAVNEVSMRPLVVDCISTPLVPVKPLVGQAQEEVVATPVAQPTCEVIKPPNLQAAGAAAEPAVVVKPSETVVVASSVVVIPHDESSAIPTVIAQTSPVLTPMAIVAESFESSAVCVTTA